ncbi:hypothetical protein FGB62_2g514 [Gracilaria domingensis]|nr:hypothetical protein FGB62_2g514 [Gracilaria domingensis]
MTSSTKRADSCTSVDIEGVSFPVDSVLVPKNADVLVLEHNVSEESNEKPEIVHILSEQQGNIARVTNKNFSDAFRKALWRSKRKNRERENLLSRKRYKLARQKESSDDRRKRLAKRRARYARGKVLKSFASDVTHSFNSDQTDSSWSSGGQSTASSSCATMSEAEASNDSQALEDPDSYSSDASLLTSSCSSSSVSELSAHLKEVGDSESDTASTQYLYRIQVQTKVLKTYGHHLMPITTVPTNGVVLEIFDETEEVNE